MDTGHVAEELRTIGEMAAKLRLGRSTVYALINSGALPTVRIGRAVRMPASRLAAFVERHARAAESTGTRRWRDA